jgi:1-pyrroline-5-carboxylate dehydrogenase
MNNAIYTFKKPKNEPVLEYRPGSPERVSLEKELARQRSQVIEIPLIIGGKEIRTGQTGKVVMPTDHNHVLATYHKATEKEVSLAIEAAMEAKKKWSDMPWTERASIMSKTGELLSTKYRDLINAATMLGQGKNVMQAEIDSACETIDFLKFNNYFASQIFSGQPDSNKATINRLEYRPLEGFIYAITPFNFTSIACNLNGSVVVMGNTTVWKPATTAVLSNYYLMKIFEEAGLPGGVINFVPGSGALISSVVFKHRDLGGIHFTGSNSTFNTLWKNISDNLKTYKSYPRIVGETGGKDFIFAHKSARIPELATAIVRGAFEYQGQKCSAASRAYIPESLWKDTRDTITRMVSEIKMGDVDDLQNFFNSVIDKPAYDKIMDYISRVKEENKAEIITGGKGDDSKGYFIEPTVVVVKDPHHFLMEEEIFGPVMTIYVYRDDLYDETLKLCDETSPFALTGSIFSTDRHATMKACEILRYAAGNFYINDKPTGAIVGQQPFGGSRASGTNDKAGSYLNLLRWANPRTIKENLMPDTDFKYPFME